MRLRAQFGGEWQDQEWCKGKGRCDSSTRNRRILRFRGCSSWMMLAVALLWLSSVSTADGLGVKVATSRSVCNKGARLLMVAEDIDEDGVGDGDLDSAGKVIEDLSWRVAKLRLEEANTRRFLKARPRYLPYDECRKWVQAWNRWDNEQDW